MMAPCLRPSERHRRLKPWCGPMSRRPLQVSAWVAGGHSQSRQPATSLQDRDANCSDREGRVRAVAISAEMQV